MTGLRANNLRTAKGRRSQCRPKKAESKKAESRKARPGKRWQSGCRSGATPITIWRSARCAASRSAGRQVDHTHRDHALAAPASIQRDPPCNPGHLQAHADATLRDLERDGMISRRVFPTKPPSVEYRLTELGEPLLMPLIGPSLLGRKAARAGLPSRGRRSTPPIRCVTSRT